MSEMRSDIPRLVGKPFDAATPSVDAQEQPQVFRSRLEALLNTDVQVGSTAVVTPLLLRPEDAAGLLSISRSRVYELMATGGLPSVVLGRSRRIPLGALQRWVEEQLD